MAGDSYKSKAEELSKKAYQQSTDCNDAGNTLEMSDKVKNMDEVNSKLDDGNDGDGD